VKLPARLRRSAHLTPFAHMGTVYLYHELYGYILAMSPDILAFLDAFAVTNGGGGDTEAIVRKHAGRFGEQPPEQFVEVFVQFACLVEPDEEEGEGIWPMVPVKGRWNVWRRGDDGAVTLYCAWGERPLARVALSLSESRMWDAFDGERRLAELRRDFDPPALAALVRRLTSSEVQAIKLSPLPLKAFKGRADLQPPYLTSTMPYPRYQRGASDVTDSGTRTTSTERYHREQIADAEAQFDHQETTLSHLLRRPHPALAGRSYGAALVDALAARGLLPATGPVRILEIGGGLGYVAAAVATALAARGLAPRYEILELSPALAAAQRERIAALPPGTVTIRPGDCLTAPLEPAAYDLILANEMIGDLPAVELTHAQLGIGEELSPAARRERLAALGEVGALIEQHGLALDDAPDPFYVNTGALSLLARLPAALAPGGAAILTEFGERERYPRLSTHLDHPELSIHFGHLERAAARLGLQAELVYVMDLLDLDRDQRGLATTRSYFRALQALCADFGVEIEKIGYTEPMFDALLATAGDALRRDRIGELRFDRIEDRLMGLVPHEFKALIARRPR
jgi:protein-L-isoaspartate O-methyltransferase